MSAGHRTEAAGTLEGRLAGILDEGRAAIAAGRALDEQALRERIRAAARTARSAGGAGDPAEVDRATQHALAQVSRLAAVHRARALVGREPRPPAPGPPARRPPSRRAQLRTRPTISGNMDVRRAPDGGAPALAWERVAAVTSWEVRFSTRESPAAAYELAESVTLPGEATSVEVPLADDRPLRVHLFGYGRDGRVLRRAMLSGLAPDTWRARWERRATAS